MNAHRVDGFSLVLTLACVLVCVGGVGCASSKQAQNGSQSENGSTKPPEPPPEPLADELADAPCGNPNWSRLPEGHGVDGDPAEAPSSKETDSASDERDDSPSSGEKPSTSSDSAESDEASDE